MIATMDLTNLLYVVGAIVGATVVSALLLLRHRRPRSVDAGIENFSRELKALQPERRPPGVSLVNQAVPPLAPTRPAATGGGVEAGASSSDGENEPG
jgi:uncharacterized alpha-E superfamily protein